MNPNEPRLNPIPISVQPFEKSYCSKKKEYPIPLTSQEGLAVVEKILAQAQLCFHDLQAINSIYQAIDFAEQKFECMASSSISNLLIEAVMLRTHTTAVSLFDLSVEDPRSLEDMVSQSSHWVATIGSVIHSIHRKFTKIEDHIGNLVVGDVRRKIQAQTAVQHLISFYHLQNFLERSVGHPSLENLFKTFVKKIDEEKLLAKYLPLCHSPERFENDSALFGLNKNKKEIRDILFFKKEKYQQILNRKESLTILQRNDPGIYPRYLNEILERGYIDLYDHLVEIKGKLDQIMKREEELGTVNTTLPEVINAIKNRMSSVTFANIVLETKSIIVQKIVNALPKDLSQKKVFFLLGSTQAGKSTTLCFLRGDEIVFENFRYRLSNDPEEIIGQSLGVSCTFLPTVEEINNLILVDFPGFDDVNGPWIRLGMKLALKEAAKIVNNLSDSGAHVLLMNPLLINNAGTPLDTLRAYLNKLFKNAQDCSIVGMTKYSQDDHFKKIQELQRKAELQRADREKIGRQREGLELAIPELRKLLAIPGNEYVQNIIEMQETTLRNLQEQENALQPLEEQGDETPEIRDLREHIQEIEKLILRRLGINKFVSFKNLETSTELESTYEKLLNFKLKPADLYQWVELDDEEKALVDFQFIERLKQELSAGEVKLPAKEAKVEKNGLIPTILGESVWKLFQEFAPNIRSEYDKKILESVIKIYVTEIMRDVNVISAKIKESDLEILKEELDKLIEESLETWRRFETKLEKRSSKEDIVEKNVQNISLKQEIEARCKRKIDPSEQTFMVGFLKLLGLGETSLAKGRIQAIIKEKETKEVKNHYSLEINQIHKNLLKLQNIRTYVEKSHQLSELLNRPFEGDNLEHSLVKRVQGVRELYSKEEWDKKINLLSITFKQNIWNKGLSYYKFNKTDLSEIKELLIQFSVKMMDTKSQIQIKTDIDLTENYFEIFNRGFWKLLFFPTFESKMEGIKFAFLEFIKIANSMFESGSMQSPLLRILIIQSFWPTEGLLKEINIFSNLDGSALEN